MHLGSVHDGQLVSQVSRHAQIIWLEGAPDERNVGCGAHVPRTACN